MSILVSASKVTKAFGARPLFEGLTFAVESGERIGLIGPNGAGKSTLLRIIAGQDTVDSGSFAIQRGIRVGFLEQVPIFARGLSVQSAVMQGSADPSNWESQALAGEIISKLSLDENAAVDQLSGGWKKRVGIARELMKKPDLFLLDEPTNHLDVESILWLEEFLAQGRFATVVITHDRLFLQRVSSRIIELDRRNPGGILSVQGSYADYLDIKEGLLTAQERRETIMKNTLRRETEWLRRGAKARTTKQQARIQRAGDLKDEVAELGYRNQNRLVRMDFQGAEKNPKKLIEAKKISKSFGGKKIFKDLDLMITPGSRIGILGPNGCGKSTLIRALLQPETVDEGTVRHSDLLSIAYFEQNRETLDPKKTLLKTICPTGDHVNYRGHNVHVRSYLDRFLFTAGQMEMEVGKLSGGEQSRIQIARLMLQSCNILVLDEPTNDLDMQTLSVLEECLVEFPGAILLVTHDRYFLDQVTTRILAFGEDGEIVPMVGLQQWEEWRDQNDAKKRSVEKEEITKDKTGVSSKKRKLSYKDQREFDSMEETIQKAELELAALEAESQKPEHMSNSIKLAELGEQMTKIQNTIEHLYVRWGELGSPNSEDE